MASLIRVHSVEGGTYLTLTKEAADEINSALGMGRKFQPEISSDGRTVKLIACDKTKAPSITTTANKTKEGVEPFPYTHRITMLRLYVEPELNKLEAEGWGLQKGSGGRVIGFWVKLPITAKASFAEKEDRLGRAVRRLKEQKPLAVEDDAMVRVSIGQLIFKVPKNEAGALIAGWLERGLSFDKIPF